MKDYHEEGARAFWLEDAIRASNPYGPNQHLERINWDDGWCDACRAFCAGQKNPYHDSDDE